MPRWDGSTSAPTSALGRTAHGLSPARRSFASLDFPARAVFTEEWQRHLEREQRSREAPWTSSSSSTTTSTADALSSSATATTTAAAAAAAAAARERGASTRAQAHGDGTVDVDGDDATPATTTTLTVSTRGHSGSAAATPARASAALRGEPVGASAGRRVSSTADGDEDALEDDPPSRRSCVRRVVSLTGVGLERLVSGRSKRPWTSAAVECGSCCLLELERAENAGVWVRVTSSHARCMPVRVLLLHAPDLNAPLELLCDAAVPRGDINLLVVFHEDVPVARFLCVRLLGTQEDSIVEHSVRHFSVTVHDDGGHKRRTPSPAARRGQRARSPAAAARSAARPPVPKVATLFRDVENDGASSARQADGGGATGSAAGSSPAVVRAALVRPAGAKDSPASASARRRLPSPPPAKPTVRSMLLADGGAPSTAASAASAARGGAGGVPSALSPIVPAMTSPSLAPSGERRDSFRSVDSSGSAGGAGGRPRSPYFSPARVRASSPVGQAPSPPAMSLDGAMTNGPVAVAAAAIKLRTLPAAPAESSPSVHLSIVELRQRMASPSSQQQQQPVSPLASDSGRGFVMPAAVESPRPPSNGQLGSGPLQQQPLQAHQRRSVVFSDTEADAVAATMTASATATAAPASLSAAVGVSPSPSPSPSSSLPARRRPASVAYTARTPYAASVSSDASRSPLARSASTEGVRAAFASARDRDSAAAVHGLLVGGVRASAVTPASASGALRATESPARARPAHVKRAQSQAKSSPSLSPSPASRGRTLGARTLSGPLPDSPSGAAARQAPPQASRSHQQLPQHAAVPRSPRGSAATSPVAAAPLEVRPSPYVSPRLVSSPRDGNDADTSARARADDVRASDHAAVLDQPDRVTEEARAALAEADADADSHEIDELQATDIIDDPDIGSDYGDGVLDLLPLSASSALPPPSSTTASARGGRAVGAVAQQPAAADASVPGDARLSVPIPVDIDLSTDDDLLRSDAQHTGELEPAAAAASRRPLMPAELTRHALEARWARMSEGVSIVKVPFGGFAKPSKRVLVLDVGSAQLRWGSSRTSLSSSLNLPTVTGVAVGVASEVFSRAPKSVVAQPELCCTISSLAGRTLDIVFETVDTAVEWLAGFLAMFSPLGHDLLPASARAVPWAFECASMRDDDYAAILLRLQRQSLRFYEFST